MAITFTPKQTAAITFEMKYSIGIELYEDGSAAFDTARVLREVADAIENDGRQWGYLNDPNGNRMGMWQVNQN